ncbi:head-tail connector protein [Cronobacter sakazakii]
MLLSPEEIKAQLRLDEDYTDEDNFLELLGRAVQARTENYLNRRLYAADGGGVPDLETLSINVDFIEPGTGPDGNIEHHTEITFQE